MKNLVYSTLIAISLLCSFTLFSQTADPSWVYLKKASNFIERGEYSEALTEVRKARTRKIEEEVEKYWEEINRDHPELTRYELTKLRNEKEKQLKINDMFPEYHYIMGDIYANTDFLNEAESEYRLALQQKEHLDYQDMILEIQYKLSALYNKKGNIYLEEMMYRDILKGFFAEKKEEYWERIRYNIREDLSLNYVFRIYRLDGIKYLKALYQLGVHEAILQKRNESLFYLSCATIVWMTYYGTEIKGFIPEFQYEGPVDFTNYMKNKRFSRYINEDFIVDKLMFFIGYNHFINRDFEIASYYFNLARTYAAFTGRLVMIRDQIEFLQSNPDHVITYEELF